MSPGRCRRRRGVGGVGGPAAQFVEGGDVDEHAATQDADPVGELLDFGQDVDDRNTSPRQRPIRRRVGGTRVATAGRAPTSARRGAAAEWVPNAWTTPILRRLPVLNSPAGRVGSSGPRHTAGRPGPCRVRLATPRRTTTRHWRYIEDRCATRPAIADPRPRRRFVRIGAEHHRPPTVGRRASMSRRNVVVFPAPFGPGSPNTSPASTVGSRPSRPVTLPNRFVSCSATIHGSDTVTTSRPTDADPDSSDARTREVPRPDRLSSRRH